MAIGKWVKKDGHWQYEEPEGAVSAADLADLAEPKAESGDFWGDWVYHAKNQTLTYKPKSISYEVRLDELKKARNVIDWVNQLHEKTWMDSKGLGDFIYALFGLQVLPTDDTFKHD